MALSSLTFAQAYSTGVTEPVFDTLQYTISSTNTFYFGSTLYSFPDTCVRGISYNPKCCRFETAIRSSNIFSQHYQVDCYDGSTLMWTSFKDEENATGNFRRQYFPTGKSMADLGIEPLALYVAGKKVEAYTRKFNRSDGKEKIEIIFQGYINGEYMYGNMSLKHTVKTSQDLPAVFQQIIQF